jgi:hypothetical protein
MMSTRRNSTLVLVALLGAMPALASSPQLAHAGGLRCSIGEVVIENLKIGRTYSLKTLANLPLTLTNTTDGPVNLAVDALVPDASELRQGRRGDSGCALGHGDAGYDGDECGRDQAVRARARDSR